MSTTNITRDAALCMYFYEEYTDENVEKCKERIEKWGNVEICYNTSPREPIVVLKHRIAGDPYTYRKYRESQQCIPIEEVRKRKRFELKTDAQLKLFLNEVFCYEDPNNSKAYKTKMMTTKDIFETIQLYTSLFDQRTAQSFAKWCSTHSVSFLKANPDRNSASRKRHLYILDDTYYDTVLEEICEHLPRYKASILNLKKNGYEIIGYVRKSPCNVDPETRVKLLQKMVDNMLDRSLVDKVYVSASSRASSPFNERDLNTDADEIMKNLKHVTGNTPDMLEYFQSAEHNVCLASIDFAGLSSRSHLVKDLLEEYPVIKKVVIELFASDNQILLFDSELLLSDDQQLGSFDCRKKLVQRSK